jgi:Tetrapyrrole (Corrin/Porphyrin) Methylases
MGRAGSLVVVGTGIKTFMQATLETVHHLKAADKVVYLVSDPVTQSWLHGLNANSENLAGYYAPGKHRRQTYDEVVTHTLKAVRDGLNVCAAFYGHPGVFVNPSHEAIRQAKAEGYRAVMLPGVSAEDCLYADLGLDPGVAGCQSYEATDFLVHRRVVDTRSALILWQIGVIGRTDFQPRFEARAGLEILVEVLGRLYPPDHVVTVYEAAQFPVCDPGIKPVRLADLPGFAIGSISTLFVPPLSRAVPDPRMSERLVAVGARPYRSASEPRSAETVPAIGRADNDDHDSRLA